MGLDKIIKDLKGYLGGGKDVKCNAIDDLLERLEDKINKIEKKLDKEDSGSKRKHLKLELKIAKAELKKGERRRKELRGKCS